MNEIALLMLSCVVGFGLGVLFFGGLWWTVRRAVSSQRPALWFLVSLVVRVGVTLGGFFVVSGGHWERLLLCLLGFLVARQVVTRLTRSASGASHAAHS